MYSIIYYVPISKLKVYTKLEYIFSVKKYFHYNCYYYMLSLKCFYINTIY